MVNEIQVSPISKVKRILLHLADLMITFILGFILTTVAVLPVGEMIIKADQKVETIDTSYNDRIDILYDAEVLKHEENKDKYSFEESFNYTFDLYLKTYVLEDSDNDIFKTYYVDILESNQTYLDLYETFDEGHNFFDISEEVKLKDEYKFLFSPFFDESDKLSETGQQKLDEFKDRIFSQFYSKMISDIEEKDLVRNGSSYNELLKLENDTRTYLNRFFAIGSIIGLLMAISINYFFIPAFFSDKRTIGMICLRMHAVDPNTLEKKGNLATFLSSIIVLPANISLLVLIPTFSVGFEKAFSLPYLVIFSLIGIVFVVISLIFILFNSFNRSLTDIMSNSVVLNNDDYDKIVYERSVKNE